MRKSNISNVRFKKLFLLVAMVIFTVLPFAVKAQDGSSGAPFPIRTAQQLTSLAQRINAGGTFYFNPADSMYYTSNGSGYVSIPNGGEDRYFRLVADITLNSGDMASCDGVLPSGATAWIVLGNSDTHPFDGVLDGDYHTIGGMYVKQDVANVGFIGITGNHAKIRNLGIIRSYVSGDNTCGGLIGTALHAEVENCFFAGTVEANGTSAAAGTIVGGLIGEASTATMVSHCSTNAMVSGKSQVGGLVGRTVGAGDPCTFTNCYSSSTVYGQFSYTGGAIGEDRHSGTVISGLYYDSQMVSIPSGVTPAATSLRGTALSTAEMTDGMWAPSGFTAQTGGIYPVITGFNPATNPAIYLTLVPIFLPAGSSLSNLTAVSSVTLGGQPEGVTWTLMEGVGTVTHSNYTLTVDGQSYVVLQASHNGANRSYVFRFDKDPLLGTAANPFTIDNLAQLTLFRDGINTGLPFKYKHFTIPALGANTCFLQTVDINMPNQNWTSIGSSSSVSFKGTYDGGNHAVIGWKYTETYASAFFAYTEGATIKNLTVRNVRSANRAALIYSMNGGTVDNCHAEGSTTIGGGLIYLTAVENNTAYIKNSTNRNSFSASGNIGGILCKAGNNLTIIDSCHNYGNITSSGNNDQQRSTGGIIGGKTRNTTGSFQVSHSTNHGTIDGGYDSYVNAGGIVGAGGTITYCGNTGRVTSGLHSAGICGSGGAVSYCYNVGDVILTNTQEDQSVCGISYSAPSYCFNAGNIYHQGVGSAYAISSGGATHCFNAGDVSALYGTAFALVNNTDSKRYSLGRLSGRGITVGGGYIDTTRVPLYRAVGNNTTKSVTASMIGTGLQTYLGAGNWVYSDSVYPRIAGLDALTISKAVSLPIFFGSAQDNVDNVTTDFTIRKDWGIEWIIEGTSGATISDSTDHLQKVTLPVVRTNGNIILAAQKGDSVYYRIKLVLGVTPPTALTVDNLTDLKNLRTGINSGSAFTYKGVAVPAGGRGTTFKVTADITLDENNWLGIGSESHTPFRGTLDGQNHTISNLQQSRTSGGLFGYIEGGTVENLNLSGVIISCSNGGSICCYLTNGTLSNCTAAGTLSGGSTSSHVDRYVGGLVAATSQYNTIHNCTSLVTISGNPYTYMGGIVGHANSTNTVVDSCVNGGAISGGRYIGGITAIQGAVRKCVNYGEITTIPNATAIAGITAVSCNIYGCVNSGNINIPTLTTDCNVAGIGIGTSVENSYNVGAISGNNATNVSGIYNGTGTCRYNYNAGQVTGKNTVSAIKIGTGNCTHCYYDTIMCTATDAHTGTYPRNTTQMSDTILKNSLGEGFVYEMGMYPRIKGIENTPASLATAAPVFLTNNEKITFVDHDFTMGGCSAHEVVWSLESGNALQVTGCSAHINTPGIVTLDAAHSNVVYKKILIRLKMDAFIIKNATELANFRDGINSGSVFYYNAADSTYHSTVEVSTYVTVPAGGKEATFRVANNIDLGGVTWTPIGSISNRFKGVFDGDNHTISNFTISNQRYSGLFGYVDNATLKNIKVERAKNVSLTAQEIGALAGYINVSFIENVEVAHCCVKSSASYIGALTGQFYASNLSNISVHHDTVQGASYIGGIAGNITSKSIADAHVSHCEIKSNGTYAGGVAGCVTQSPSAPTQFDRIYVDTTNVSGTNRVGGIFGQHGYNHGGRINYGYVRGGTVTGSSYVGGIAGMASGLHTYYCFNSARVKGTMYVGGIHGCKDYHNFQRNTNIGEVEGDDCVGGLIGIMSEHCTAANDCYASVNAGKVKGITNVGGVTGSLNRSSHANGAIVNCTNTGDVEGEEYVGGIIGQSQGETRGNANAGRITGVRYVGGLVGHQTQYSGYTRALRWSYSCGQVYGVEYVGNVAGYSEAGTIKNCYYDKQMSARFKGLGSLNDDASGIAEGKLTREMLNQGIRTGLSNDTYFTYTTDLYPRPKTIKDSIGAIVAATPVVLADTVTAYTIPGRQGYAVTPSTANSVVWNQMAGHTNFFWQSPSFKAQRAGMTVLTASRGQFAKNVDFVVGVSSEMPCIIKNDVQLTNFTNYINAGTPFYYNTEDSTFAATAGAAGIEWIPIAAGGEGFFFKLDYNPTFGPGSEWTNRIGTPAAPFKGDFNGAHHIVSNLPSANADTCGFFGCNAGTIRNLVINNANMSDDSHNTVAALCGYNSGRIDSCSVKNCEINGNNVVAAIAAINTGYVSACYSSSKVNGNDTVAGICAVNTGSITSTFNMGDITADTYAGGIAGVNTGSLANTYNVGNITASDYAGGLAGKTGTNLATSYNAGQVNCSGSNAGGIAGNISGSNVTAITSVAYDDAMCTLPSSFQGGNSYNTVKTSTQNMVGSGLQSTLGTSDWVFTANMYPRLRGMDTLNASQLSATPIFLTPGENVQNVCHDFTVSNNNNTVTWTQVSSDALVMDGVPSIVLDHCGTPTLQATRGDEQKNIPLQINFTGAVEQRDTTCGEPYLWEVSGLTYNTTHTAVVNRTVDGCPYTYTLHVVIPAELKVNVTSEPETCVDANDGTATATVTGGLGSSYTYEWTDLDSNRATPLPATATITGLAPEHEYRVIVTDALNTKHCTVRDSIEVEAAVPLVASIDSVSAGCYGSVDGMFEVSFSGGKANYVLSWSGASTGSRGLTDPQVHYAVTGLNNGNHTVVVRDSNNCTTTLTANLVEDSREYTITAFDTTKLYDGVAVNAARYTLNYGTTTHSKVASGSSITLDNGDVLTATMSQTNPTNAGIYSNQVNYYVVMRGSEDVTCQYNITPVNKNVVINKRNVIVTSADSSKFYNSASPTPLTNHRIVVSGDRFTAADSALITYNVHGSQLLGGVSDNDFDIEWNGVNANNYTVTKVYGTLTVIENGMLIVRAKSLNRAYDGTSDTYTSQENVGYTITAYYVRMPGDPGYAGVNNEPDTVYGLGPQYRVEVEMNNGVDVTMKDVDTVNWRVTSIHAYYNDGVEDHDVTMSFKQRDTIHGVLQVNPVEITMTSDGGSWVYDGITRTLPDVTMVGSFVSGEISGTPTATGSITNVGKVTNTISFTPTGSYLAKNYHIVKTEDTLKVTPRPLNISGVDTYVDYTGSEQTTTDFTYSNLVSGHTASGVSFSASGTEVGEYVGAFVGKESLSVVDGSNNDVTANYDTIYTPGTLYIRSLIKELRVISATVSEMYDGQPHTAQTYTVNFGYQPMPSVVDNLHFKLTTGDTVVVTPGAASQTDVGSVRNDFDLTIRPAEHFANYTNIVRDTGIINVIPREVILRSLSLTKTYDGTAIVYDTAVAVGNGFVEGQGASYTFSNPGNYIEVGTYPNAFDYSLNAGTNPANYTFVKDTGSLVITPAVLTVKAVDVTRTYGEPNVFDYTITGYQGSDDVSVVSGLDATHPSYTCDGDQFANIGTYTITPVLTGLSAGNYTLEPATGTLTIQRRVLTVNAPSVTAAYDGNTHNQTTNPITGTITYTNLAPGDEVTYVALSYSRVDGGETPMTYSSITIMHDGVDVTANYNVLVSDTSKLIITKRDLTVKVKDTTKIYDGTALVPEYYEIVAGELATGDAISNVTYSGTQTSVGTSASSFSQIRIVRGGNDVDVSSLCYNLVLNDGVLTVTPKAVTVTANPKEKVYGASDPTLTATVTGLLGSDVVTYTLSRAAGEAVGKYAITPTGAATQGNYAVTYVEDSLTITKANLVVNVQDATKVYGESDPTFTATLSGLQNGDTQADILTLLDLQFTRTSGENVGTYTISATGNALTNYNVTYNTGTLTITKAALTVTADAKTKVYGGADPALTVTFTGVTGEDTPASLTADLGLTISRAAGEEVGTYTITPMGAATHQNYTVTYTINNFTITPAAITIKADDKTKVYDNNESTDPALTATVTGVPASGVAPVYTLSRAPGQAVDNYTIFVSAPATSNPNYTITTETGTFSITKRDLTIAINDTKEYDGTALVTDYTEASATGLQNGATLNAGAVTTPSANANTYTDNTGANITTQFATSDGIGNYNVSYNFTQKITQKTLTITANSDSKVYDGTALTNNGYTNTALASTDHIESVTVTGSQTVVGTSNNVPSAAVIKNASNVDVTASYDITYANGTLEVTQKALTITANSDSKVYDGTALTNNGYTNTTLATGDHIESVTVTGSQTVVGTSNNVPSAAVIKNASDVDVTACYDITYANGTLEVTQKTLTITANSDSKVYDGTALTNSGYTNTTLATGDNIESVTVTGSQTVVGTSNNVPSAAVIKNASDEDVTSSYDITYTNGTLEVTQKALTITANSDSKVYDGTALTNNGYTNTTLATGDHIESVTVMGSQTVVGTSNNVPSAAVIKNASDEDVTACYDITYANGTLEVTQKALTITANSDSKVYDGTALTNNGYTNTALASTDHIESVTVTGSQTVVGTSNNVPSAAVIKNASDEDVTASYDITYANGTLEVTKKAITITADDKTKVYDNDASTDPELTATVAGVPTSGVAPVYTLSRTAGQTVGIYTIMVTAEAASNPNYTITTETGTFSITPRDLTIALDTTKVYDGTAFVSTYAATGAGYTVTGLQNGATITAGVVTSSAKDVATYIDSVATNYAEVTTAFTTSDGITNYNVIYDLKQVITPRELTIKLDTTKVYDGLQFVSDYTATTDGYTVTGLQNSATVTAGVVTSSAKDVATYIDSVATNYAEVTTAFTTSDGISNYNVTYDLKQVITQRDLLIEINDTKVYDGTPLVTDYTEATATGLQNGATLNAGVVTTPSKDVNIYTDNTGANITTAFGTTDGITNYNVTYDLSQTITPCDLTIKLDTSKVYDGTAFVSTYAATGAGYTVTGLQNGATITAGVVTSSAKDVATYIDSVATNYAEVTTAFTTSDGITNYNVTYDLKQVITPRDLTIKLDTTKVYDGLQFVSDYTATTDGYTVTGLQNSATVTAGVVTSSAKDVATYIDSVATNYAEVTTAFATSDGITNYNVTYDLKQVITQRDLTIKLDTTKVYDGTAFVSTYAATGAGYTVTGLQNGATVTAGVVTSSAKDVATYIDSVATNYAEVTTAFATSDDISNYNVTYDLSQTITPRDLTIQLDTTKVYDGTAFVSTYAATGAGYTVTGLQNGATVTAGVVTSSAKDVATYIDSVATHYAEVTTAFTTSDDITNYNVIYDLKQVITPATLTIQLDTTKVYDGTAFVSTYAATGAGYMVTGLQNGATVTAGAVTSPSANVGTYTDNTGANITTAFTTSDDISNYTVTYDLKQVITPRPGVVVTIQEHGAEVEFNGTDQRVTGYSVSIADPINLYTVADFSFIGMVGDSIAHGTGSADALHIYDMNLRPAYFRNDNTNYMDVTFQISDSALYIYPNLKAEATTTQVFCHTGNNGTATIEVTGGKQHFGKYYFSFEGGTPVEFESPHTYTDLQEGNYSVEVTDSLGYHVTVNFSITEVEQLVATIVTPTDLCPNQGSYPVRVNVTGGTIPYTYTWTGAQAVDADATQVMQVAVNDGEETYAVSVSVLDVHNCPATDDATFTLKPSVEKVGSVTYTCSNDTSVTLRYGVYDTLIILNQPTWTSNIPSMPLTLVPVGKPVTDRYAIPEGREDTTYIVKWHIVDTCGGDTLICTQRITVAFPDCAGTVNDANGNSYEVIRLGANCWTKPNYLAVPEPIRSTRASSNGTYKYNNDDALFNQYGYLYTWYAVCHLPENNNSVSPTVVDGHIPGICPAGWALPTVEDYVIMVEAAGGLPHVKAADDSYWITGLEGSVPSSGFDALGAGYYKSATDSYEGLKTTARFWTATPSGNATDGVAVQCGVCESEEVLMIPKADGCSLRCVKINP